MPISLLPISRCRCLSYHDAVVAHMPVALLPICRYRYQLLLGVRSSFYPGVRSSFYPGVRSSFYPGVRSFLLLPL
jgi:hypothetical protein